MHVRDAIEADADAMAAISDAPRDVMRNLVHDRTVRVAVTEEGADRATDASVVDETATTDLLGFVSYDAESDAVHVTQLDGVEEACERLLSEPIRFAETESMAVELLVPIHREDLREAASTLGFEREGFGPRFDGARTVRFRLEP